MIEINAKLEVLVEDAHNYKIDWNHLNQAGKLIGLEPVYDLSRLRIVDHDLILVEVRENWTAKWTNLFHEQYYILSKSEFVKKCEELKIYFIVKINNRS